MKRLVPVFALAGLCLAVFFLPGCAAPGKPGAQSRPPISENVATQIGIQSMNQDESWEPDVEYEAKRDGEYWKVYGYKTRGKDMHGNPIYEPGVYRVVKISPYGKVVDFWRVTPRKAGQS